VTESEIKLLAEAGECLQHISSGQPITEQQRQRIWQLSLEIGIIAAVEAKIEQQRKARLVV